MDWTIEPNQGLGPLHLGMTQAQVAALPVMGRAGHVYRGSGGRVMEYRGPNLPLCEYHGGVLCRIGTGRHVDGVRFAGVDLYAARPLAVLRLLEARLGALTLCQEQVFVMAAGLCLDGFYDPLDHSIFDPAAEYHDERGVTLFAPAACGPAEEGHEALSFL
ncbi:MAG: hypothetical protein JXJ18_04950 [Rhodobacteraceae bacterium]|nr:hypothetical protein [Paracoccaceae bacterium]